MSNKSTFLPIRFRYLSIICSFVIVFAVGTAHAQPYQYKVAPCGTKDFTTTADVVPGGIVCLDIYLTGVGVRQDVGDAWIDFTGSTADIAYVSGGRCLLDGSAGCTGPWDPAAGAFLNEPAGPGTIMYVVSYYAGAAPDGDGNIIVGTVTLKNTGPNDATVNIAPIAISVWDPLDPEGIVPGTIIISQVSDCTTDIDCDDRLFCNGTETCIDGICSSRSGDPCVGGGSECNDTCQEVGRNCYAQAGTLCTNGICDGEGICFTPSVYYVDGNVLSSGNGTSWEEAFKTIQEGINSASNRDTVLVADGVYTGVGNRNLDYEGKIITVSSVNGPENCIIDCEDTGRGFCFRTGETSEAVVDGFKIVNGYAEGSGFDAYGGGIVLHSSPTITNCIFDGNWGERGGGACVYRANPTIINCVFTGNSSEYGGGITVIGGSPKIINCIISGNTGTLYGGGICPGSATVKNCIISGNSAGIEGGGVWSSSTGNVTNIINSTIVDNSAAFGGGIYCTHYSSSFIRNSILWNNTATNGPQIAVFKRADWSSWPASLTVNYSLVQGGQGAVYVGPREILYWGEGNIDEDPLFVDPDGFDDIIGTEDDDLHLQLASPCIDTGTPFSDYSNEPEPNGCLINMGAYGNTSEATYSSDSDIDGDGVYSLCDNCSADYNPLQEDTDNSGIGDACNDSMDPDGDEWENSFDNCPNTPNPNQEDTDNSGIGNACNDSMDPDGDEWEDDLDNCLNTPNSNQEDYDGDTTGDACDDCTDTDSDGYGNPGFPNNICDVDNCPDLVNVDQEDGDEDGMGNACDNCPYDSENDIDSDGTCGDIDNCPNTPNSNQEDYDGDTTGDACDDCTDTDSDGYGNPGFPNNICDVDNCPDLVNVDQEDDDLDGVGNACDNCPYDYNDLQTDYDGSGIGDVCNDSMDADGDEWEDDLDNCPNTPNPGQEDTYPSQGNGIGDACDCEADFNCDGNVDADDVTDFLWNFGRHEHFNPCREDHQCYGDFSCDGDVDAEDVTKFLEDFGRGQTFQPCPACEVGNWCTYDGGDVDECALDLDDCVVSSRCVNTNDSYVCDCGLAPPADDYVVDQYQVNSFSGYTSLSYNQRIGQSFTVGQSGFLAGIEFSIAFNWGVIPEDIITVNVFPCSSPTSCNFSSLGTIYIVANDVKEYFPDLQIDSINGVYIDFSPLQIEVYEGDIYLVELSTDAMDCCQSNNICSRSGEFCYSDEDCSSWFSVAGVWYGEENASSGYANGTEFVNGEAKTSSYWVEQDFLFKTFVESTTEPNGCEPQPNFDLNIGDCSCIVPDTQEYRIGNPPPSDHHCSDVSCPFGYEFVSCEDTCAGNPNCEASGETWYANLTCVRVIPDFINWTVGNPPPSDHHCDDVLDNCPSEYQIHSCEDTCAGNPNCESSGETWYARLICINESATFCE